MRKISRWHCCVVVARLRVAAAGTHNLALVTVNAAGGSRPITASALQPTMTRHDSKSKHVIIHTKQKINLFLSMYPKPASVSIMVSKSRQTVPLGK